MINRDVMFSNKKILVTGGSSGIGKSLAVALSKCGASVLIAGRSKSKLESVRGQLMGQGHSIAEICFTNADDSFDWITKITESFGPLDGLFHGSGIEQIKPIKILKQKDIDLIFGSSLMSAFGLMRGAFNSKVMNQGSSIVLMSSVSSKKGIPGMSAYSVAKAGINSLTQVAAREFKDKKIRVNSIICGEVNSEMHQRITSNMCIDSIKSLESQHPLGLGDTNDVASLAMFLLSKESAWMTGSSLVLDGGYLS